MQETGTGGVVLHHLRIDQGAHREVRSETATDAHHHQVIDLSMAGIYLAEETGHRHPGQGRPHADVDGGDRRAPDDP